MVFLLLINPIKGIQIKPKDDTLCYSTVITSIEIWLPKNRLLEDTPVLSVDILIAIHS